MPDLVFDTEIYENFFIFGSKNVKTGRITTYEYAGREEMDIRGLKNHLLGGTFISFNGWNFDGPVLSAVLAGFPVERVKDVANAIIDRNMRPWQVADEFGFEPFEFDHVDLIEVAPGQASLKIYAGRAHAPRMQDLPIDPYETLTPEQMDAIADYLVNDLDNTQILSDQLAPQISLRSQMSIDYGMELRSKSDAQIAEAVIKKEVSGLLGHPVSRPSIKPGTAYKYPVPDFIKFETNRLNRILDTIRETEFVVSPKGSIGMPDELADAVIRVGEGRYKMGIGGLHSMEKAAAHVAGDDYILVDRDVASYYPAIIINLGLHPAHMHWAFLKVYKRIVDRRLAAKAAGDKVTADALKITINGSFGKFGSKWSALYSPDLLIRTTITGQLSLLMLIEMLHLAGVPVVSANTDGIVIKCPKNFAHRMDDVIKEWEAITKFTTEESPYEAIYSRDVNNYVAIKKGGGVKAKGVFGSPGLSKNPETTICVKAAIAKITHGTPIPETIKGCRDIREFVAVRTVKGGATKDGEFLGKAIRWYYSTSTDTAIHYKIPNATGTHNMVPKSEGAMPIMDLPDDFPDDIDYLWYIRKARAILVDLAYEDEI